ncbi:hypothetical protein HZU75_13635 [Chitinibacter fontanus]|uniref:Uncharacterized protein n=1 Tax=Chitinibacter fontanus TaxID=1737446 RepID=A0A7D5Z8B7_9NEIS|nr:hypothetical protein [Chitinibacter fontanus]QLI82483.1 hypothetical protein HZU75_13635 [Chitinibacter fontanus]
MRKLSALLLASAIAASSLTPAFARNEGSEILQSGLASIMLSPLLSLEGKPIEASGALGAGSALTVVGVSTVTTEAIVFTVEKASDGSRYMIKLSGKAAQELGLAIGSSIKAISETTGYALIASGKLVAFIPNEIGNALLGQSKLSAK